MTIALRTPHKLYKRYQDWVEGGITAIGLALIVTAVLVALPVYPPNWAPVLVAVIFLVGVRWSLPAYILAVLTVLYPIYSISLYLAILFLALTILAHRPFSHYLGATVLVLAVPVLARYHLHWLVPIIAGLWWGAVNGVWMAALAAFWGKLLGGMAGLEIDWLVMAGQSPSVAGLLQRYQGIDALETLLKLLQPFATNPTVLLYHLLQIALWAMVAALMGFFTTQKWVHYKYPWSTLLVTTLGAVALALGHILLASWLSEAAPPVLNYSFLFIAVVFSLIVSSSLEVTRKYLDLPLAPTVKKRHITVPVTTHQPETEMVEQPHLLEQPHQLAQPLKQAKPTKPVKLPDLPEWEPPDEDNDLILLELD